MASKTQLSQIRKQINIKKKIKDDIEKVVYFWILSRPFKVKQKTSLSGREGISC